MEFKVTGYELQAQGREPLMYENAEKAGAAFFNARRDDHPKVLRHEVVIDTYKGVRTEEPKLPSHVAVTAADLSQPSGYSHVFLDADAMFRHGYEEARKLQPEKAVMVQDINDGPLPTSTTHDKGPTVSDQQKDPITMDINGMKVVHVEYHKFREDDGPHYSVSVRAIGTDGHAVIDNPGVRRDKLHELVGKDVAQGIIERADAVGKFRPYELPSLRSRTVAPEQGIGDFDRLTFSKKQTPDGLQYDVRSYDADGVLMKQHLGIPKADLAKTVGDQPAKAIMQHKGRSGAIDRASLQAPDQAQARPATVAASASASVAQPVPDIEAKADPAPKVEPAPAQTEQESLQEKLARSPLKSARHMARDMASARQQPDTEQPRKATPSPESPAVAPKQPEAANSIELAAAPVHEPALQAQAQAVNAPSRQELRAAVEARFEVASVGTLFKPADEYRFKDEGPARVAFTDYGKRMATNLDKKEVVQGMVDLAQAKGWREIDVKGTLEFRRQTWMQGNLRGINVQGYEPSKEDRDRLKAAREQMHPQHTQQPKPKNSIDVGPAPQHAKAPSNQLAAAPDASPTREQWMAVTRQVLTDQNVDKATVDRTMQIMGKKVDQLLQSGQKLPPLMVYDKAAPSLAPAPTLTPVPQLQPQRAHDVSPGR